jgi:hypothetical protein
MDQHDLSQGQYGTYWYKDLRAGCEGRSELIASKREEPDLTGR